MNAPLGMRLFTVHGGSRRGDAGPVGVTIRCSRPALAAGGSRKFVIVLTPPGSGTFAFHATLTGLTTDPSLANNTATTTAVKP